MPKRSPIEYTPAFGGGVFRSKEQVTTELAEVALPESGPNEEHGPPPASAATRRSNGRTVERSNERIIVRHSFDIGQDQLIALAEIQMRLFHETGRKPKLGPLVQDALDAYIARQRKRTNGRTNDQTDE